MKLENIKLDFKKLPVLIGGIFILLTPIFYNHNVFFGFASMRVTHEQFLQMSGIVLFAFLIENVWMALFLLWTLYLYYFFNFQGGSYVFNVLTGCVIYKFFRTFGDDDSIKKFFKFMAWVLFVHIGFMILQRINYDPLFVNMQLKHFVDGKDIGLMGIMGLIAMSGMFLAILLPVIFYFNPIVAALLFYPIYLSQSSAAFIAAIVGYLFCM